MAKRNTSTRNSPYKIDAVNYTTADAINNTTGQSGGPRNNTSTWEKLNSMCFDIEWTIGAEGSNSINVTAQLLDLKGRNLGRVATVLWSLHVGVADATFGAVDTAGTGYAVSTGVSITEHEADAVTAAQTDTDGKLVVAVEQTTGADLFKVQISVGDRVFQSPLITFA